MDQHRYKECCGVVLCLACHFDADGFCPVCKEPDYSSYAELIKRLKARVEAHDAEAMEFSTQPPSHRRLHSAFGERISASRLVRQSCLKTLQSISGHNTTKITSCPSVHGRCHKKYEVKPLVKTRSVVSGGRNRAIFALQVLPAKVLRLRRWQRRRQIERRTARDRRRSQHATTLSQLNSKKLPARLLEIWH